MFLCHKPIRWFVSRYRIWPCPTSWFVGLYHDTESDLAQQADSLVCITIQSLSLCNKLIRCFALQYRVCPCATNRFVGMCHDTVFPCATNRFVGLSHDTESDLAQQIDSLVWVTIQSLSLCSRLPVWERERIQIPQYIQWIHSALPWISCSIVAFWKLTRTSQCVHYIYSSLSLSLSLSLSVRLSVCLSVSLSLCLSVCLSAQRILCPNQHPLESVAVS